MAQHKLANNKIAQDYVIDCLALGKTLLRVVEEVKEEFDIEISDKGISWYKVHRRAEILARRQEMENRILDQFPYALMALRQQKLHDCLKEAEKIGKIDVDEAAKLMMDLPDKYRKDAIVGIYSAMGDGRDRRLARIQSLLKQIKDEVAPLRTQGKDDDEKNEKPDILKTRLALKNASKEELAEVEKAFDKVFKKHAKDS